MGSGTGSGAGSGPGGRGSGTGAFARVANMWIGYPMAGGGSRLRGSTDDVAAARGSAARPRLFRQGATFAERGGGFTAQPGEVSFRSVFRAVMTVTGSPRRCTRVGRSRCSQRDTRAGSVEMMISS
jgi:hypothetical protein